ncbi:MAG: hypothetical protein AAFW67_11795, partial [Cyanobacteria bacterium J06638_38]
SNAIDAFKLYDDNTSSWITLVSAAAALGTDLGLSSNTTSITITSSTGNDVNIPFSILLPDLQTKVSTIENNAKDDQTGEEIRDLLQALPTGQKLQASDIEGIPSSSTNISISIDSTGATILSSTGSSDLLPNATTSQGGIFSASDKTKLNGVQDGAEVNSAINQGASGVDIFNGKEVSGELQIAKLLEGAGITLVKNPDGSITISSSSGDSLLTVSDGVTTAENVESITFTSGATITDLGSGAIEISITGGGGGGSTNISVIESPTELTIVSSTGTNGTFPLVNSTNAGAMSPGDKIKIDGIEAGATVDQTGSEIKALYESEPDTNAFTDADESKLDGIENNAKDDQDASEVPVSATPTNYSAATQDVEAHLSGIDTALGNSGSGSGTIAVQYVTLSNISNLTDQAIVQAALDTVSSSAPTLLTNDKVLLKDQTDTTENGTYTWDGSQLIRTSDTLSPATEVRVFRGDTLANSIWYISSPDEGSIILDTTNITFTEQQFGGSAAWGGITGNLSDQTDVFNQLRERQSKFRHTDLFTSYEQSFRGVLSDLVLQFTSNGITSVTYSARLDGNTYASAGSLNNDTIANLISW